jgi:hypothetical protein
MQRENKSKVTTVLTAMAMGVSIAWTVVGILITFFVNAAVGGVVIIGGGIVIALLAGFKILDERWNSKP